MLYFFKSIRRPVKHWYIPLILGILFILCGIGVIISPQA
ncbi:MAG: HdeD family acid-resistance protein, partial [Capnocytophaga ochracea]